MADNIESDTAVLDAPPSVRVRPVPKAVPKRKNLPQYALVLENDSHHTFDYVIDLLQRVCGHKRTQATILTLKIHLSGDAAVWTGPLEVAELKQDQVRGFGPDLYGSLPVRFPLGTRLEPLHS